VEPWISPQRRRAHWFNAVGDQCAGDVSDLFTALTIEGSNASKRRGMTREGVFAPATLWARGGAGKRDWFVNGQHVRSTRGEQRVVVPIPEAGRYQFAVIDETGSTDMIELEVAGG
jgi:penicillin-binding protein 1C